MSRHSRRSDNVQTEVSPAHRAAAEGPLGEIPQAEGATPSNDQVGKYWVVILLWSIGFASLIGFEIFAAIFRR